MTLCFFSAQYLPTVGGVERYTFNLAKRAVQAGHQVLVDVYKRQHLEQVIAEIKRLGLDKAMGL